MMGHIWSDLRYGVRMMSKAKAFAIIAVLTLAIGIGANTAIFSVINTVLLRPLPYAAADRIVYLNESSKQLEGMSIAYPDLQDWIAQSTTFEAIGATQPNSLTLTGSGEPEMLDARS